MPEVRFADDRDVVEQLSAGVPAKRSAKAFVSGAPTAVRTTRAELEARRLSRAGNVVRLDAGRHNGGAT